MCICQLILGLVLLSVTTGLVLMRIEQDQIELGKPLKISCEIINGTINGNRRWVRGETSTLLCFNGVPTDITKYNVNEEQLSDVKYQLTISNVTEDDINCPYACRFGFQSAETYVNADEHNFRNLPNENMIDTKYVINKKTYSLSVKFHDVYPVPSCAVILKSQSRNLAEVNKTQNGLLYDVQFSGQSEEPYHLCDHPVNILCYFGRTKYPIEIKHNVSCDRPTEGNILLPVVLSLSALVVIIVIIVLCHRRRRRRQLRNRRYVETEAIPIGYVFPD